MYDTTMVQVTWKFIYSSRQYVLDLLVLPIKNGTVLEKTVEKQDSLLNPIFSSEWQMKNAKNVGPSYFELEKVQKRVRWASMSYSSLQVDGHSKLINSGYNCATRHRCKMNLICFPNPKTEMVCARWKITFEREIWRGNICGMHWYHKAHSTTLAREKYDTDQTNSRTN